ncbi:hypothetical protein VN97_g13179, partial [Penicillium thymicola]
MLPEIHNIGHIFQRWV